MFVEEVHSFRHGLDKRIRILHFKSHKVTQGFDVVCIAFSVDVQKFVRS